jgi:hypothetical protein
MLKLCRDSADEFACAKLITTLNLLSQYFQRRLTYNKPVIDYSNKNGKAANYEEQHDGG